MSRAEAIVLLSAIATAWVGDAIAGDRQTISVRQPSGEETNVPTSATSASATAKNIVGSKLFAPARPMLVEYEDRESFGPDSVGVAWSVRGNFEFPTGEKSTTLPITVLVDSTTGRLVVAYTDSIGVWPPVTAPGAEVGMSRRCKEAGWEMGHEIPEKMQSTVTAVVQAMLRKYRGFAADRGQFLIRPRWITPHFPARRVGDKLVPVRGTEKVWIIQVCGLKDSVPSPPPGVAWYTTESFIQMTDGTLENVGAMFAP